MYLFSIDDLPPILQRCRVPHIFEKGLDYKFTMRGEDERASGSALSLGFVVAVPLHTPFLLTPPHKSLGVGE